MDARTYANEQIQSSKWIKFNLYTMTGYDENDNEYYLFWLTKDPNQLLSIVPKAILFTNCFYETNRDVIDLLTVAIKRLLRTNTGLMYLNNSFLEL